MEQKNTAVKKKKEKRAPYLVMTDTIIYNPNIPFGAQKLFSVVNSFCEGEKGCFVQNDYLSNILFLDGRTVCKYIALLEKWNYIYIKNKKKRNRTFYINKISEKIYIEAALKVYQLKDVEADVKEKEDVAKKFFLDALQLTTRIDE